ncbi:cytochrome c maturation protein CcmE [Teredinibacter waterburyi]|uniref:cytochrome c maturation protein CcmE n=1 Tax=Teredinibacter waterburyi TaxID=1500538 RepID=UPI00165F418D|nr:cytochrome c maturation protein CcmE [Teredinibacter waterburyi]
MHPKRKQRLIVILFIVVVSSAGVGLTLYSLGNNLNLFYPPSSIVDGTAPVNTSIRAGGCVVPGSVERSTDGIDVSFKVTDGAVQLPVTYNKILPDLFSEGEAVVLTGKLNESGIFVATKVLAKHDENYTPPEVSDSLQGSGEHQAVCEELSYDS